MKLLYTAFGVVKLTVEIFVMYLITFMSLIYGHCNTTEAYLISTVTISFLIAFAIQLGVDHE